MSETCWTTVGHPKTKVPPNAATGEFGARTRTQGARGTEGRKCISAEEWSKDGVQGNSVVNGKKMMESAMVNRRVCHFDVTSLAFL